MKPRTLGLAALLLAGAAQAKPAETYATYYNGRFGQTVEYPVSVFTKRDRPPANGIGQKFFSKDHKSFFMASGRFNVDDYRKIDLVLKEEADSRKAEGWVVADTGQNGNWCVLRGKRGDKIFYEKALLTHKKQVINKLYIEYPASQKDAFEPIIMHMAKSFREGEAYGLFD